MSIYGRRLNSLYVWKNMMSLRRYGTGKVIAYAENLNEARAFAIGIFTEEQREMFGLLEFYEDSVKKFTEEILAKEPEIFHARTAIIEWGSE